MNRDQATALLPCYVAGDLPAPVLTEVEQALDAHPELAAHAEALRDLHDRTTRAVLQRGVPRLLRQTWGEDDPPVVPIELPGRGAPPPPERAPFPVAVIALAVAATLMALLAWSLGPSGGKLVSLPSIIYTHQAAMSGQAQALAPHEPEALVRAFTGAGVPARLRAVPDLTHLGLETDQVYLLTGPPPGAAISYRADGVTYLGQARLGVRPPARPAAVRDVDGIALHAYLADDVALVMWNEGDVLQVMSARVPVDDLLDLVTRRVTTRD